MKRQPTLGAAVTALAVLASACQDGPAEPFTPGRVASPSQRALVGAPDQAEPAEAMYGFGGLYIDDDGVPTLNVTDLGEVGGADGVVRDFLGRRGIRTQRLRMRQVEFTLPELDEWFVATSPILEESGAVFIDLDERANRVVIGVEDASMLQRARLFARDMGVPEGAVQVVVTEPIYPMNGLQDSHRPDVPPPAVPLAMLDLQPFVVPGAEAS